MEVPLKTGSSYDLIYEKIQRIDLWGPRGGGWAKWVKGIKINHGRVIYTMVTTRNTLLYI